MWRRSLLTALVLLLGLAAPASAQDERVEAKTHTVDVPPGAVSYETVDDTAKANEDYEPIEQTPVPLLADTVKVESLEDSSAELDETFIVRFSTPGGAEDVPVTITDDDPPAAEVVGTSLDENAGPAALAVVLSTPVSRPVSVGYSVVDGSAKAGSDFDGRSGRVEIPAGQRGALLGVPIVDDGEDEPDETFTVRIENPTGATIKTAEATVTIRNDDVRTVSVGDVTVTEADGENAVARLPVTLNAPTNRAVTVRFGTLDVSARAPNDYLSRVGAITFQPGQTTALVEIAVVSDDRREADEVFGVLLANPENATLARGGAAVTIKDDDGADAAQADTAPPVMRLSKPSLRGTAVRVKVTCPRSETRCAGRLTLFSAADRRSKRRTLRRERRLGRVSFSLRGGQARTLRVRIPRTIVAAARATGRLKVRAFTVTRDSADTVDTSRRSAKLRFKRRR